MKFKLKSCSPIHFPTYQGKLNDDKMYAELILVSDNISVEDYHRIIDRFRNILDGEDNIEFDI